MICYGLFQEMSTTQDCKMKNIGSVRAALKAKAMGFSTESTRPRHHGITSLLHSNPSKTSQTSDSNQRSENELNLSHNGWYFREIFIWISASLCSVLTDYIGFCNISVYCFYSSLGCTKLLPKVQTGKNNYFVKCSNF